VDFRRTILLVLAAAVAGLLGAILLKPNGSPPASPQVETTIARSTTTPAASIPSDANNAKSVATAAANISPTPTADRPRFVAGAPAQKRVGSTDIALQNASTALRDYQQAFHQNPVGSNAEITARLLGKNAGSRRYLPNDAHINSKGELTDRWNEPLFFHQISATVMEIRSAGPDHVMWTEDDEVLR
jgi:hypothetical protein